MESLLDLTEIPEGTHARMARLRGLAASLNLAPRPDPVSRDELLRSLEWVKEAVAGRPAAMPLAPLIREVEMAVREAPLSIAVGWRLALEGWIGGASTLARELGERFAFGPPAIENLPPELRERLVGKSGRYLAYLYPSADVMDPEFLPRFNRACRAVSPEVAGWPLMFEKITGRITSGFSLSLGAGAGLVILCLALAFRSLRTVVLALIPLIFGILWLLGLMGLLGVPFNLGNLVAVPIILGVGIDSGVHLAHRVLRAGPGGVSATLHATGRGIIAASFTTMGGFGALSLASHRGMASLGVVLLLGVLTTLLAALFLFPSLMFCLGYGRDEALEGTASGG